MRTLWCGTRGFLHSSYLIPPLLLALSIWDLSPDLRSVWVHFYYYSKKKKRCGCKSASLRKLQRPVLWALLIRPALAGCGEDEEVLSHFLFKRRKKKKLSPQSTAVLLQYSCQAFYGPPWTRPPSSRSLVCYVISSDASKCIIKSTLCWIIDRFKRSTSTSLTQRGGSVAYVNFMTEPGTHLRARTQPCQCWRVKSTLFSQALRRKCGACNLPWYGLRGHP